jgi:hypothetical protein
VVTVVSEIAIVKIKVKSKGKGVPVHAVKTYTGSRYTDQLIFNVGSNHKKIGNVGNKVTRNHRRNIGKQKVSGDVSEESSHGKSDNHSDHRNMGLKVIVVTSVTKDS